MRKAQYSPYDDEDMYAPPKRKPTPRRQRTFMQKALDHAQRNPKRVIGGAALFGIAAVISLNALEMQHSRHPAPMFAQAPAPAQTVAAVAPPVQPPPRPVETQAAVQASAPEPAPAPVAASAPAAPRDVIGDIIRTGSTTRAPAQVQRHAVTAPAQIPAEPHNAAPAHTARVAAVPVPARRVAAAPRPPQRNDAIGNLIRGGAPATHAATADEVHKRKVTSVQQALNKLKYGPLPANGVMGSDTQKALKRFEFDRRLPVTGTLNTQTLAELAATSRVAIR